MELQRPRAQESAASPDLLLLVDLRVVLGKLERRVERGQWSGRTPALLVEAKRLAVLLATIAVAPQTRLPVGAWGGVKTTLDALDALRNRLESSA